MHVKLGSTFPILVGCTVCFCFTPAFSSPVLHEVYHGAQLLQYEPAQVLLPDARSLSQDAYGYKELSLGEIVVAVQAWHSARPIMT